MKENLAADAGDIAISPFFGRGLGDQERAPDHIVMLDADFTATPRLGAMASR